MQQLLFITHTITILNNTAIHLTKSSTFLPMCKLPLVGWKCLFGRRV